ncbi:hypothetical protein KQI65_17295 [bacterium]|nr:hypothetical protein [bacterium]
MRKGRYHILIGSFLVAAMFWFSVTMGGSFRTRLDVPLSVSNMPKGLALVKPLPREINVLLEARGWQLLWLSAGKQLRYEIPGSRLRSGVIQTNRSLTESMVLPVGVKAIRAYPETLFVQVDRFVKKKVPLHFRSLSVSFKPDFGLMRDIEISPDSIVLEGAERVLRGITSWPIAARSYEDLALPVAEEVPVLDSLPGVVRLSTDKVNLHIATEQLADVSFDDIRVEIKGVPPDREVLLGQQSITVSVRGGVNYLSLISADDFSAEISFRDIVADTSGTIMPTVHFPAGLRLLKTDPEEIRYTIRK